MKNKHWAIAVKSKATSGDLELPTALRSCVEQLGYTASVVEDGDPAGLHADILLFLITLGDYPVYAQMLKRGGVQRPVTVLWQLDPLPPEDFPPEAEQAGLQACRWRDFFKVHHPPIMSRRQKLRTLYRLRLRCYQAVSAFGFRKACRIAESRLGGDFDRIQLRAVMENWQDILDSDHDGWVDHYVMSTNQRHLFLLKRGLKSHFIPVGAHAFMGRDLNMSRDIQVGFIGARKIGRRAALLKQLEKELAAKGISLVLAENGLYGERRCEWLNRTRILINLYNYPWSSAWTRFLMASVCKTLVVSEPIHDEHPMKAGVHYVTADIAEMPEVIGNFLDAPDRIDRMVSAADILCRRELTLLSCVQQINDLCRPATPG